MSIFLAETSLAAKENKLTPFLPPVPAPRAGAETAGKDQEETMSADQADRPAKQFEQSMQQRPQAERPQASRLHEQYKPLGIPAVSAAAQFASKMTKKSHQMS